MSFAPGRSAVLQRNDDYWEGAPHLDELEFVIANEESARINALLGGQVEYAHDLTPTTARTHEGKGRIEIVRLREQRHAGVRHEDRPAAVRRPRLREAMFLLADRQQLVDGALSGAGRSATTCSARATSTTPTTSRSASGTSTGPEVLLKQAGAEGLMVTLDTSAVAAGFIEAASDLRRPGQGRRPHHRGDGGQQGHLLGGHPRLRHALSCYRSGAMPIETHISQRLLTDSTTNVTKWARPDFDALYQQALSTSDETARAAVYEEMQRTLHAEGGYLMWGFADWIVGTDAERRRGLTRAPANTLDWARFDKVWLG